MPTLIDLDALMQNANDEESLCTPQNLSAELLILLGEMAEMVELDEQNAGTMTAEDYAAFLKAIDKAAQKIIRIDEPQYIISLRATLTTLVDAAESE
jgi:hypothetical protein